MKSNLTVYHVVEDVLIIPQLSPGSNCSPRSTNSSPHTRLLPHSASLFSTTYISTSMRHFPPNQPLLSFPRRGISCQISREKG